jgi:ferredoxin--NADP+ reductase
VQANINYGLGLEMKTTAQKTIPKAGKAKVPLELEKGELPLNTYSNKTPFEGKILSVERIVGPKATGETTHIIIEHGGKMPYWEGQSYGVIPPVRGAAEGQGWLFLRFLWV